MNKTLLLIIGVVIAVVVGVGAIVVISQRAQPTPTPVQTATPQAEAPLRITITPPSGPISASASASFDVLLNTNGVKIDGFQFIANLDGDGVVVSDSDPVATGVQITPASVTGMNPVTNSVVGQGTAQVIRYAMITQNAGQPFSSSTPVKVATVSFIPGAVGTIKLEFNTQNTRANKTGTTEDTLITAVSQTFTVGPAIAAVTPATSSASTARVTAPSTAVACDAACLTDNDCSLGLSCISNSCRNPTNPTSLTCAAAGASTATTSATPVPSPTAAAIAQTTTSTASATPRPTATATPRVATIAALPSELPESGSVENTIYLVVAGLACIGLAAFFMLRTL